MPDHCTLKTRSGADCRAWAIPGTDRCSQHAAERLRPRLTPEVTDRLLVLLRNGDHVDIACEAAGIPRRTFYDWWRRGDLDLDDPSCADLRLFRARVEEAKSVAESRQVMVISQAAKTHWQAAAWLLERRYPDRWARVSQRGDTAATPEPVAAPDDPFTEVDELAARRRNPA